MVFKIVASEHVFVSLRNLLPNLTSLTLENVKTQLNWVQLFLSKFVNIKELRLINVNMDSNLNQFQQFLNALPILEVFVHVSANGFSIAAVTELLFKRFPNMSGFGYKIGETRRSCYYFFETGNKFKSLEISVIGDPDFMILDDIRDALHLVRNIEQLYISKITLMLRLPIWIRFIVKLIKEIIENRADHFSDNDHIHVFANEA